MIGEPVRGAPIREPVGIMQVPDGAGWLVVCSDGAVFAYNPKMGGGVWIRQKPVPGTRADLDGEQEREASSED
jgi:hypothetical protein